MYTPSMRLLAASAIVAASAINIGCYVETAPPPPPAYVTVQPAPPPPPPVVDGAVVVDVLPPPEQRVYIYDPGYPPGCFVYGGFVYYGGYRYQRDVFVNRVVNVNIHENRYVDINENRRQVDVVRVQQRNDYVHYGGRPAPQPHVDEHHEEHHDYYH